MHACQGVIQDFEVEGGNEKSNQKVLLKKGQLLFQYPAMDTQSYLKGGGDIPLPPVWHPACIQGVIKGGYPPLKFALGTSWRP